MGFKSSLSVIAAVCLPIIVAGCDGTESGRSITLTAAPSQIEQGTATRVFFDADENLGSGGIEFSVAPAAGLSWDAPEFTADGALSVVIYATDDAALGARDVQAIIGSLSGQATLSVVEHSSTTANLTLTPSVVPRATTTLINVVGEGTHFDANDSQLLSSAGSGVLFSQLVVADETHATLVVTAEPDATLGMHEVQIRSADELSKGTLIVDVGAAGDAARVISVVPTQIQAGTSDEIVVVGENTSFSIETTVEFASEVAIVPSSVVALSSSSLSFTATADGELAPGSYSFEIKTPRGQGFETVSGELQVNSAATMAFHPIASADQGDEELIVQLVGLGTHFNGETLLEVEPEDAGVQLVSYYPAHASIIDLVTLSIAVDAVPGDYVFAATTPMGQTEERVSATFEVKEVVLVPQLEVNPVSGVAGQEVELSLIGTHTGFEDGLTSLTVVAGEGLTIDSYDVLSATEIEATVTLDRDAPTNTIELQATTGEELVAVNFELLDYTHGCGDFDFSEPLLTQGRYNEQLGLNLRNGDWPDGAFTIDIDDAPPHVLFDPARCSPPAAEHLSCFATVGLFAQPEKYMVWLDFGTDRYCGVLEVGAQQVFDVAVPSTDLPALDLASGQLDYPAGIAAHFYRFTPQAGDALVFHAFSDDRANLDPTLSLIDSSGDERLLFVDDETLTGIDSRFVYHFDSGAEHFIKVGVHTASDHGPYRFYVHRLTQGATVVEAAGNNDTVADAQLVSNLPPYVLQGTISDALDVDVYEVTVPWPAAVDVVARRLGPWDGVMADLTLSIYDDTGSVLVAQNSTWFETPASRDPRVFLEQAGTYYVRLESEENKFGFYSLNVRPAIVINEVDNRETTSDPFVELLGPPATQSSFWAAYWPTCDLCTYDDLDAPVDPLNDCVTLADFAPSTAGYAVARDSLLNSDALAWSTDAGAVVLRCGGDVIDQVQFGVEGSGAYSEGAPADKGTYRTIGRGAGVDTNSNELDFIYMAHETPGQPNDRTYQAAIPLFGEPEG